MTRGLTIWALCLGTACGVEDGRPPVARIEVVPGAIPEHDGFRTEVALDATASSDPIDDPEGARPLSYTWVISGDEFRFESGDGNAPAPVLRFRGDSPAVIELTVEDEEGLRGVARRQLVLSIP